MNITDAAKILGLTKGMTAHDAKDAYYNMSKKYHPDINPAGLQMMKMINEAWETLRDLAGLLEIEEEHTITNYPELLCEAIMKIIDLEGLDLEICGAWLWVSGETKEHKDILKSSGFKYASKKQMWYYRPECKRVWSRGRVSMGQIRSKYGTSRPEKKLAIA